MEVDELPDTATWGGWFQSWVAYPSPELRMKLMKRELGRRIMRLEIQIKMYEKQRKQAQAQLTQVVRRGNATDRRTALLGQKVAKYDSLQDQCAYSIIKYQQGLLTLEKLDQMRQSTTDFHKITRELTVMNRKLNMGKTVKMAKQYDRQMDIMESKEETMSELLVERDEMDSEAQSEAQKYVQKAREAAGLDAESSMPSAHRSAPGVRQHAPALSQEDKELIARLESL